MGGDYVHTDPYYQALDPRGNFSEEQIDAMRSVYFQEDGVTLQPGFMFDPVHPDGPPIAVGGPGQPLDSTAQAQNQAMTGGAGGNASDQYGNQFTATTDANGTTFTPQRDVNANSGGLFDTLGQEASQWYNWAKTDLQKLGDSATGAAGGVGTTLKLLPLIVIAGIALVAYIAMRDPGAAGRILRR